MIETTTAQTLRDAIENLYGVFAAYPLNAPVTGCPHCTKPEDYARLESKPLRELTSENLGKYAFKALSTWGGINDFKHFLPRLFELIAWEGSIGFTGPEVVFGKLPYSKSSGETWSDIEQRTIESFCLVWWQTTLDSYGNRMSAEECLTSIGRCIDDLSPFLTAWRNNRSISALRHLADYVSFVADHLIDGHLSAYWDHRSAQSKQVVEWLLDPQTKDALEALFWQYTNEPTERQDKDDILRQVSDAVTKLEWAR